MKSFFLLLTAALSACSGPALLNSLSSDRGVEQATNIIYHDVTDGRLDIYAPKGANRAPVVIFLHGGRWSDGDKSEYVFAGNALARRGYVAVVPNLRKYPQVRFPAFVEDAAQVLKWSRGNIATYGGDGQKTFIMGHSSGAHIAAMLALDEHFLKDVGGEREWIKGMIGLAGPYDFMPITAPDMRDIFGPPEDFEKSQPIFNVDGRNPPLLLIHGEDDDTVGVKNTRNLAKAVKAAGGAVETVLYLELSHRMAVATLASSLQGRADVIESVVDFITRTLEGRPLAAVAGEALAEPEALPEAQALPPPEPEAPPQPIETPPPAATDERAQETLVTP